MVPINPFIIAADVLIIMALCLVLVFLAEKFDP